VCALAIARLPSARGLLWVLIHPGGHPAPAASLRPAFVFQWARTVGKASRKVKRLSQAILSPLSPCGRGVGGEGCFSPLSPLGRGVGGKGWKNRQEQLCCLPRVPLTPSPSPRWGEGRMAFAARDFALTSPRESTMISLIEWISSLLARGSRQGCCQTR